MGMIQTQSRAIEPAAILDRLARRFVLSTLAKFPHGSLQLREPDGNLLRLGQGTSSASLVMHDWRVYRMMFTGGALGAGEAYMEGLWDSDDLTTVIRYFSANIEPMQALDKGLSRLAAPLRAWLHIINRNSVTGSRKNIAAHYDLGNDFFRLFLDPTMMYSAAVYPDSDATLEEASVHKLDMICQALQLKPGVHLLEIGTGWGGLAVHAAKYYGCQVTTTTISAEQFAFARKQVRQAGLEDQVIVLDRDYRELHGRYDRIVSVEMIEAVGPEYLPGYFRQLGGLLNDDGLMLLQAITIPHRRYDYARRQVDFIKKYIFPGGFLPSLKVMSDQLAQHTRLEPVQVTDIGLDYGRTLHDWRSRFRAARDKVQAQGFDERFIRMWDYYLSYCEGAFLERAISTVQLLAAGPEARQVCSRISVSS